MPATPRVRSQLTIQASPVLLAKVRALAAERRQTVTALVVDALEALLSGPTSGPAGDDLRERIEAIERRLAALEHRPAPPAAPIPAALPEAVAPADPAPPAGLPPGAIPTVEVARITGTAATGWNRWAAGHRAGDVWQHPRFGPWRLLGKLPAGNGGTPRWMWEPVTASDGQS